MYYGVFANEGKRVSDEDAFSYACEMAEKDEEMQREFMAIAVESETFEEFRREFVEWAYSGNWIHSF